MNPDRPLTRDREDDVDIAALLRTIWQHRIIVSLSVLICGAAALTYALTATPTWRAEVSITDVRENNTLGAGLLSGQLSGLATLAGVSIGANGGEQREARAVLRSRHLAEEFIRRNALLPMLSRKRANKPTTLWTAVKRFQNDVLTIHEDLRQGVTTVDIEWTDAATAAKWANEFVALANDLLRTHALDESQRNINYLNEQVSKTNVVELQKVMYNLIEGEEKTLMVANGRLEYAFRVVDPAVAPEIRSSPRRTLIVLGGLFVGVLIGGTIALVRGSRAQERPRGG